MLQCVGCMRIYQIPSSQAQSVFDAFIMSATTPPKRHNPKRGLITAAKVVIYFGLRKIFPI